MIALCLKQVEEGYTREALMAGERERDLGEKLRRAEEQIMSRLVLL